ncbi:MAG TPA: 3-oxoacyl-[acyl-carrier-protein] synthase III C-terminal domain-containing protein, partial [Burkholderiaceae bacterium]
RQFFTMDGPAVKAFAIEELARVVEEACGDAEIVPGDLALIVAHQSNRRLLEAAVDELGVPEGRMHITVDKYGNTAAASIPLTLDDAVRAGRLHAGDLVCLVGYGGGLASAACVVRW